MKKDYTNEFKGIVVPVLTPVDENHDLDEKNYRALLEFLINSKVDGLFVMGSTGECTNVKKSVWLKANEIALKDYSSVIPVYNGAIDSSTYGVIEKVKMLEQMGAKVVAATPFFYMGTTSQAEIVRHYEMIASRTDLKLIAYGHTGLTHVNIAPETLAEMAKIDNLVAYKDTRADWEGHFNNILALKDTGVSIFNAGEYMCGPSLLFGAQGNVSGLANFFPSLYVDLYNAAVRKDVDETYRLNARLAKVGKTVGVGCWVSAMKYIGKLKGQCTDICSGALEPLTEDQKRVIEALVADEI